MLFRSTGLGKSELVAEITGIKRQGDYIIMYVDVIDPVKWRLRVGLNLRDLAKVTSCIAKRKILSLVLSPRQWGKKEVAHPGDF